MFKKLIVRVVLVTFFFASIGYFPDLYAQSTIDLPAVGAMVNVSNPYQPLQLKGILVDTKNPLRFDFLVDKGNSGLYGQPLKNEIIRLSKYFLTCLTVPDNDLWVNLSPYEKDRIIPNNFGVTLMGEDLLEQDYLLKQIMASLSYPENELGKHFWERVYRKAYQLYGTTQIPIDTFNKVWILPKSAEVYAMGNSAFVVKSRLDVMLDADYTAFVHHREGLSQNAGAYSQVLREVILPELRQEVNEGKNFSVVRQVYNAVILATWYKRHLKDSLLGRMYIGQNKVAGVDISDKHAKEKIFQQYLRAYKKCVYNYIKEDYDPFTQQTIVRKYASGGMFMHFNGLQYREVPSPKGMNIGLDLAMATVDVTATDARGSMVSFDNMEASVDDTHPFHQVPQLAREAASQHRATFKPFIRVPGFLRPLILSLALGVGGLLMTAPMASGAAPAPVKVDIAAGMNTQDVFTVASRIVPDAVASGVANHDISPMPTVDEVLASLKIPPAQVDISSQTNSLGSTNVFSGNLPPPQVTNSPTIVQTVLPQVSSNAPPSLPPGQVTNSITLVQPVVTEEPSNVPPAVLADISSQTNSSGNPPIPMAQGPSNFQLTEIAGSSSAGAGPLPEVTNPVRTPVSVQMKEIFQWMESSWTFYTSLAILGIGAAGGALLLHKKKGKKNAQVPLPFKQAVTLVPNKPVNIEMIIQSSNQPPAMAQGEEEFLPELEAKLEFLKMRFDRDRQDSAMLSEAAAKTKRPLSLSDALAWLSGMLLAGQAYGSDPVSLTATAFVLPLANAAYSTGNLWIHEMGHLLAAAVLYPLPRYWKKIFTKNNGWGNLNFDQWKGYFLSHLLGQSYDGDDPNFKFSVRDWGISGAGIAASIVTNVMAFVGTFWVAMDHTWLMPLLGIIGVNGYSAIKAAILSDIKGSIKSENSDELIYPCGVSVHNRILRMNELAAKGYEDDLNRLEDMMRTEGDRGLHGAGAMAIVPGQDGKTATLVDKELEGLRGPHSDSIGESIDGLGKKLPPIKPVDGPEGDMYVMFTAIGHNRLASGGTALRKANHPHIGPIRQKVLFTLKNGQLIEGRGGPMQLEVDVARPPKSEDEEMQDAENVAAGAAHNGDGDAYQPLPTDRYIENLDELRAFAIKLVHFKGDLPPGDSPVIPLLIQWHLTQGDPDSSANFAFVRTHYKTIEDLMPDLLTEQEEALVGEPLAAGIRQFGSILSRPGLNDPDKTLSDMYVSKETADQNPYDKQIQFQYRALLELKKYLVQEYKRQARAGNLPEKLTKHWQGADADKLINKFVELAVYKFFTGDRDTAVKEFQEFSKGTYGLAVKVSTDLNGFTLVSRRLGMVYGYNLKQGYLDASSDPYALMQQYSNGDQLSTLVYLKPQGLGQQANFYVSKKTGHLFTRVYSFDLKKYLSDAEIQEQEFPQDKDNKYWWPLHKYKNSKRAVLEDMELVTQGTADLVQSLDEANASKPKDDQPFNYQSGMEAFSTFLGYWIDTQIEDKMFKRGLYYETYSRVHERVNSLVVDCMATSCSEKRKEFLEQESAAGPENSVLMVLFRRWLSLDALRLAERRIKGEMGQKQLQELIPQTIQDRADELVGLLSFEHLDEIYTYWDKERKRPSSGKEKIGALFAGDENSDNGPRSAASTWTALLPRLPVRFVSSHEIMDYPGLSFDITSPWVTILTSKAGGNYNTMQDLEIMSNAVGLNHIWGVTSTPASPLSIELGQKVRRDSPFNGHVFYTKDHYRAQTQGASETLISAFHNILPIFVALQFQKYCPGEHPFGLDLNASRVNYLKSLERMMVLDAKRITGRDAEGDQVVTSINKELVQRGIFLAKRLWETPAVLWYHRLFVLFIFLGGPLLLGLLQYFGFAPGPVLNSLGGFTVAITDYLITMFLPYMLTLMYRKATGYNPWVLPGPPANICVVGKDSIPEVQEMFLRVSFSRAFLNWGTQVLSQIYQKSISRLGPALKRGSWIFAHIPSSFLKRDAVGTLKQLKVTKVGIFGTRIKRTGAISFTTSRGPFKDPDVSDYNVDLQGTEFLPPKKDDMMGRVYNNFDAWSANVAFKMAASVMIYVLTLGGRTWEIKKVNSALSLTTESGQQPPETMPENTFVRTQGGAPVRVSRPEELFGHTNGRANGNGNGHVSHAMSVPDGGIDMEGRWINLKISGEDGTFINPDDDVSLKTAVRGMVPRVSGIVTVTPQMLKIMLGKAYLN